MWNILATLAVSAIASVFGAWGVYNYAPLSFFEHAKKPTYGSTITTILGTDTLSASRTTINDNFTALNNGKIENSTTSVAAITTLANLSTVGTITSGTWNGSVIGVAYNGTGTTSPTSNQIILGNGSSGFKTVNGFGTSGQFLTSNGAATAPSWTTSSVDQTLNYTWTGQHTFNATTTMATSTIASTTITVLHSITGNYSSTTIATTSGSYTWVRPPNVNKVFIELVGGGGGGGGTTNSAAQLGASGGGAGGYCYAIVSVTGNVSFTVGAGGAGGAAGDNNGTAGTASSFGSYTANGGNGGASGRTGENVRSGGTGGTATSCDINITGQDGEEGNNNGTQFRTKSGDGGSSQYGQGGRGLYDSGVGNNGTGQGSGGGGASSANDSTARAGGNGASGLVKITWW